MATTKSTTPRSRSTSGKTARSTKTATPRAKADDSLVARTGRTIKQRPYTSAAIATGAVTVVAAAAAGAYLLSRREKSFKEASGELTAKVKDGFASASDAVKDGFSSASVAVKDLGQRGAGLFKGEASEARTQQEIAEEALTLKETGTATSPVDELTATEIKTGAIAY